MYFINRNFEDMHLDIQHARGQQYTVEMRSAALLQVVNNGELIDAETLRSFLEGNAALVKDTRQYLDDCLDSIPITLRHTPASTAKAVKVFGIHELFEHIALYLHPRDLLNAIKVKSRAYSISESSPKLEAMLNMRRSTKGFMNIPFPARSDSDGGGIATPFDDFQATLRYQQDRTQRTDGTWTESHHVYIKA